MGVINVNFKSVYDIIFDFNIKKLHSVKKNIV